MSRRIIVNRESRQGKIKEGDVRGQIQIDKIFYEEMKLIANKNNMSFNALVNDLLKQYYNNFVDKNSHDAKNIKIKACEIVSNKEAKKLDKKLKSMIE